MRTILSMEFLFLSRFACIAASQIIDHEEQIAAHESKINTLHAVQSQPAVKTVAPTTGKRKREDGGEQRAKKRREDLSIEDFFSEPLDYTEEYLKEWGSTIQ